MPNDIETVAGSAKPVVDASVKGTAELSMEDVDNAVKSMAAFEKLKSAILKEGIDRVNIKGKEAITRAGFSKIALAFNVSTEIMHTSRIPGANYTVEVTARATNKYGRYAEGTAACEAKEMGSIAPTFHNIEAKAATRATNRAIANLVGGGILSKEELESEVESSISVEPKTPDKMQPSKPQMADPNSPATDKQKKFAQQMADKAHQDLQEAINYQIGIGSSIDTLTKQEASQLIDYLMKFEPQKAPKGE